MACKDLSAELLEEMLKRAEVEFFPKLRRYVENFIDLFNHDVFQAELEKRVMETKREVETQMKSRIHKINETLRDVGNSTTLFDMLERLRYALQELLRTVTDCVSVVATKCISNFIENLLKTGFHSMLLDEELSFLDENKGDIRDRAKKLVSYIKNISKASDGSQNHETVFNEYIASWELQVRKRNWEEQDIRNAIAEMTEEAKMSHENHNYLDEIIDNISAEFEPLRIKLKLLVVAKTVLRPIKAVLRPTGLFVALDSNSNSHRDQWWWFENTRNEIVKYINGEKTNEELLFFLEHEDLEKDIEHFKDVLLPWIDKRITTNNEIWQSVQSFVYERVFLPKKSLMLELERMSKFLYAVVLNNPDKLKNHQDLLTDVISAAVRESGSAGLSRLIPCVSFGQIPLVGGHRERVVLLTFVLDQSKTSTEMDEALKTIKSLYSGIKQCALVKENGINLIKLQIGIGDNIAELVANSISKLSDLSIRGILVGDFGLKGFRNAMNPKYNRIYSIDSQDKAEGFIPTFYTGSLDRGGEPYFCPNGWRRYAIDVGMTGEEFEQSYASWPVAYHGTSGHLAMTILLTGLEASGRGCFIDKDKGEGAVYLSPSIEYSGHPRYATVWHVKDKYVQMILQVRIDRKLVFDKKQGTLPGAFPENAPMDSNFKDNMELEWVIKWPPRCKIRPNNGIVVYGLMMRVTDEDPALLPCNKWWGKM